VHIGANCFSSQEAMNVSGELHREVFQLLEGLDEKVKIKWILATVPVNE
jgi:hypothetical protein